MFEGHAHGGGVVKWDLARDDLLALLQETAIGADEAGLALESALTGESLPVDKEPGDEVTGGAINGAGLIRVRAGKGRKDRHTLLSDMALSFVDAYLEGAGAALLRAGAIKRARHRLEEARRRVAVNERA